MSTMLHNNEKRRTKQVRISEKWHKMIKQKSVDTGKTMSQTLDWVFEDYMRLSTMTHLFP